MIMEMNLGFHTSVESCDTMTVGKGWCSLEIQKGYHRNSRKDTKRKIIEKDIQTRFVSLHP